MELKTYLKYATNILGIISALLIGFNAIEGINIPYCSQIVEAVAVIQGVIGGYLTGTKVSTSYAEGIEAIGDEGGISDDVENN